MVEVTQRRGPPACDGARDHGGKPCDGRFQYAVQRIRDRQEAVAREEPMLDTSLGMVVRHEDGPYQAEYGGESVLWIPPEDYVLQARMIVCAHKQDAGHQGVKATTHRLGAYCVWDDMEKDLGEFVRQCLYCTDHWAGNIVPRLMGDQVQGTEVGDALHFDYLSQRKNDSIDVAGLV